MQTLKHLDSMSTHTLIQDRSNAAERHPQCPSLLPPRKPKPETLQAIISKSQQQHKYQYVLYFSAWYGATFDPINPPPKKNTDQTWIFNSRDYNTDPSGLEKRVIR